MILTVLPGVYAICQLEPTTPLPDWLPQNGFVSITRTAHELSLVCLEPSVPPNLRAERGWRLFEVAGPLDFALTGILASLLTPLAEAKISVFALSTFDTDYLLVKRVEEAIRVLEKTGHHLVKTR